MPRESSSGGPQDRNAALDRRRGATTSIAAPPVSPPPVTIHTSAASVVSDSTSRPRSGGALSLAKTAESKRTAEAPQSIAVMLFELAPSWLTSIVVHMLLVIALGLIVFNAPSRQAPIGFELGGGSGQGGFGGELEDSAGLAAYTADADATPVDVLAAPSVALQPMPGLPTVEIPNRGTQRELSDLFVKGAIRGPGDGFGTGEGSGKGIGRGVDGVGSGNGAASTRTQMFGVVEEASSFVYVFDRSDSMNSVLSYSSEGSNVFSITPLEAAKAELLRSLEDLTKQQRFQIVFYNNATSLFRQTSESHHLLMANKANKQQAEDYVSAMPGAGGTYHQAALEIALKLHPDAIFLLTDGEEKDDPTLAELKQLRKLNRGRTRINVIHFCLKPRTGSTLEQLARENRGKHLSFLLTKLVPNMMDAANEGKQMNPANERDPVKARPNMAPSRKPAMDDAEENDENDPEEEVARK
ncbi:MAG TPA: hypothetical protein VGJ26_18130 [Pirellulales bacterium]